MLSLVTFDLSLPLLTEKKKHKLKVENYVLFGGLTEDYSLGWQHLR